MQRIYSTLINPALLFVLFLFLFQNSLAQNVIVSDDAVYTGEASAMLDVKSTDKGMLVPRLSTTQRINISSPVEGLFVYDTDLKKFYFFDGTNWLGMPIANAYATDTSFVITEQLLFENDAVVWDDLRVPVESTGKGSTRAPGFGKFLDNGSGSQGIWVQWFDDGTEEELYFTVQLPHSYKLGSDIQPHIHWVTKDDNTGDVVWGLEYSWANMGDTYSNTNIITGTGSNSGSNNHHITSLGLISGTGKSFSSMLVCRIFRDASNSADTFSKDAGVLEVDFHFQVQSLGTHYDASK